MKNNDYCFVQNGDGKPLSPTKLNKAWVLVRKDRASIICLYPMVIRLKKTVPTDEICRDEIRCGIDDGGKHVGIALVQKCRTRNKVLFMGTIEQRNDVKKKMSVRAGYRSYRRYHKRYRQKRFDNRKASRRKGRIAPSILQKREATFRVVCRLNEWINVTTYYLEDVAIDIRALTDGRKLHGREYQKSNRLDENIRKAVIFRDGCRCRECGKKSTILEVHHIRPRRLNGSNTLDNLITLCGKCHDRTEGREEQFMDRYFKMVDSSGDFKPLNHAQHVMIGKKWLREQLSSLGFVYLTTGGDTANTRIDWGLKKSHAVDALCITDLKPDRTDLIQWTIKPMRRKSKGRPVEVSGYRHRDIVEYTYRNGETHRGYVTALYPELNALNFQSPTKHCKKVNASKCRMICRPIQIYWLPETA